VEVTENALKDLPGLLTGYKELSYASVTVSGNEASLYVELTKKKIRKSLGQMDVFAFEKELSKKLSVFEKK
jgi:hypothetical protein